MRGFDVEIYESDGMIVVPAEKFAREVCACVRELGIDETARRLQFYLDHEYVELADGLTARRVVR